MAINRLFLGGDARWIKNRRSAKEFAVSLHLVHIIFGLFGAVFVLISGFDTAGRTALTKGACQSSIETIVRVGLILLFNHEELGYFVGSAS